MGDYASEFVFGEDGDEWGEYSVEGIGEAEENESMFETKFTDSIEEDEESADIAEATRYPRFSSFAVYKPTWRDERAKEAAALEQEKRERFRKLMGMDVAKEADGVSIETVISYQEEEKISDEESFSDTSIHRCLKTVDISDSQLKLLNIFNDFPIPEDPGLVPAFWVLYPPPPAYKSDGIQKFGDLVKSMGLRPINSIKEMLQTENINLRYYGIDPRIVRAICEAVSGNTSVQSVDLRDNRLTADACGHLKDLLVSNELLTRLDLSGCRIGAEGAKNLQDGISAAPELLEIDLSRCDLGDEGLTYVATAVYYSKVLQNVNLSDNHLGDGSAEILHTMLAQSENLKSLNLSWNSLYGKEFSKTFFNGLAKNVTLQYLDMSWNGLGKECTPFLCSFLMKSEILLEFDLSANRFTAVEGALIARALSRNAALEILRLGDNPLEQAGALALVKAVTPQKSPHLCLKILDLQNVWADKDILPELEKLEKDRPGLKIKLGGILNNYKLHGPDPRKIFLKRANFEAMSPKKKKQRKNFGHFVLGLKDEAVSKATFQESVQRFKLKLTDSLIDEIMNAFAISTNLVDQTALKAFYLQEYPDTRLPTPKPKKKKKAAGKKIDKPS